jgi:NAD(P)-dependent dehydrogenase (short-subunit alcohol dehydrogenase family)
MSVFGWFQGRGDNGFGYNSTAEQVTSGLDLKGRRILVTGAASGLGLETVRVLALRGASVVAAARTAEQARQACAAFSVGAIEPVACDLSEPASVRACVETVRQGAPLDAIIANAGIMALPKLELKHGYEAQFFTNHVGHFLLVTGLVDHLADNGRVVMVSSRAHMRAPPEGIPFDNLSGQRSYDPWTAYGVSKVANLLFARQLAKRLAGTARTANALHPGVIRTNLSRHMGGLLNVAFVSLGPLMFKTIPQGAATQCFLATHPSVAAISGEYFADCNVATSSAAGRDMALAERLWQETERIVAAL